MSGSSMDGIDLACCSFEEIDGRMAYTLHASETIPYNETWRIRLSMLNRQSVEMYQKTHVFYGRYIGQLIKDFIQRNQLQVDLVASHGHTIFHNPSQGYTAQIGDASAISAECNLPVVNDFRVMDLVLGGQGAPLVPVGERDLFPGYDAYLNLGGIANLTLMQANEIKAFDVSPCNIVFNRVARWMGLAMDKDGAIAANADIDSDLLDELNDLDYYYQSGPKSLGREWINSDFWPIIKRYPDTSEEEKMATLSEHIAHQIADILNKNQVQKVLVSGGGALNKSLIQRITSKTQAQVVIADNQWIHYKEAFIFAYLGWLRVHNRVNVLRSVTGSSRDHVAGVLSGEFNIRIN